jgi:hypothetical protein
VTLQERQTKARQVSGMHLKVNVAGEQEFAPGAFQAGAQRRLLACMRRQLQAAQPRIRLRQFDANWPTAISASIINEYELIPVQLRTSIEHLAEFAVCLVKVPAFIVDWQDDA